MTRLEEMLEGIRHYPKKEKLKKSKLLILVVLPLVLIVSGLRYLFEKLEPNTSRSTSIVIEPKIVEEISESDPEIIKEPLGAPTIESTSKGLDEVIENYEASTYNQ